MHAHACFRFLFTYFTFIQYHVSGFQWITLPLIWKGCSRAWKPNKIVNSCPTTLRLAKSDHLELMGWGA